MLAAVIQFFAQARMRPRQLGFGKTRGLAAQLGNLGVVVAFDVIQPQHGARHRRQQLERALEIELAQLVNAGGVFVDQQFRLEQFQPAPTGAQMLRSQWPNAASPRY